MLGLENQSNKFKLWEFIGKIQEILFESVALLPPRPHVKWKTDSFSICISLRLFFPPFLSSFLFIFLSFSPCFSFLSLSSFLPFPPFIFLSNWFYLHLFSQEETVFISKRLYCLTMASVSVSGVLVHWYAFLIFIDSNFKTMLVSSLFNLDHPVF